MNTETAEERTAIIEPYLDFIIKDKNLLREIYPVVIKSSMSFLRKQESKK